MDYDNEGKFTYDGLWRFLLGANTNWVDILRGFYPDKPLWHLHLFVARYWGVQAEVLHALQNDLEKFTCGLRMKENFWKDPFSRPEKEIRLSYQHFACLDEYLRCIAVQGEKSKIKRPNDRRYDRIYQAMYDELWRGMETLNKINAILFPPPSMPPDPKWLIEVVKDIASPMDFNSKITEWIAAGESQDLINYKRVAWLCCQGDDAIAEFHSGDPKKAMEFTAQYFSNDPSKSIPSAKKAMQNYTTKIVTKTPRNRRKQIKTDLKKKLENFFTHRNEI